MSRFLSALALSALVTPCLGAQEILYGLEIRGAAALGDLKQDADPATGIGGSAFILLNLYDGHAFRPRFDLASFRNGDFHQSSVGKGHELRVNFYSLGVDYNYFFSGRSGEGPYLVIGGSATEARSVWHAPLADQKKTRIKATGSAGLGINPMPHVGLEFRINTAGYDSFDDQGKSHELSGNHLVLGLSFQF